MTSTREDVQRELDAIKTERRRRQRELLHKARPSRGALATSSPASTPSQHVLRTDQLSSCPTTLRGDDSTSGESPIAALAEPLLPYRPETAAPPNVLRMAYVTQSNGHLSPCPEHVMGSFVEKLDLSPWDVSSGHTDELWRQSRCILTLKMSGRADLDEEALAGLSGAGSQLTSLELSNCSSIPSRALGVLLRGFCQLTALDVSGCLDMGDEHVAQVTSSCSSLTALNMSSCQGLTDEGLAAAVSDGGLSSLQRLLVSGCPGVGDGGLRSVLDGCVALEELSAGGCEKVTGRAFLGQTFPGGVSTVPVRRLKQLDLAGCRRLDSGAVGWITAGCTGLRALVISGCVSATPEGVELLAATHPALQRLDVAGCVGLGGTVRSFVAERRRDLRRLVITNIPTLAARVVGEFLRNCGRLEYVDISGLTRVNSSCFRGVGSGRHAADAGCPPDQRSGGQGCDPLISEGSVGEQPSFGWVGGMLPHLKVARMLRLPNIDDASIMRFASACPKLEELHLSDSPLVTGACLATVSSMCPLLRSLGLDRCSAASDEHALAAAFQGLPRLEHLALAREGHGRSADRTAGTVGRGRHESALSRRAPFGGTDHLHPDRNQGGANIPVTPLTGETLLVAAWRYCSQLMTLGLEGHERLTFDIGHSPPGSFPSLTELRLASCISVDDASLPTVLEACPRIRTLSLSGSGVSQEALVRSASVKIPLVEVLPPVPLRTASVSRCRTRTAPLVGSRGGSPSSPSRLNSSAFASSVVLEGPTVARVSSAVCNLVGARGGEGVGRGAAGLRPAEHCHLKLAAEALLSRFEEERLAVNTLSRALRRFMKRPPQQEFLAARTICRAMLRHRFRASNPFPEQVRLAAARKVAKYLQARFRERYARERDHAATGFQSLWRRYSARCMFVHQLRLGRAAVEVQRMWRGHYIYTRFRVVEKLRELKLAKKVIGKQWFKGTAASRISDQDPAKISAEQRWREDMREGIRQCTTLVRAERRREEANGTSTTLITPQQDAACRFGAMPPVPRHEIVPGAFDAHPKAHRLRDGRQVYFAGAGSSSNPNAPAANEPPLPLPLGRETGALRDPVDFDISRQGASEKWQGDGEGGAAAVSTEDRALAAAKSAEGRSEKERSLCGLCRRRFAGVLCVECRLAYCFRCSANVHAQPARRGHGLGPFTRPEKPSESAHLDGGKGPTSGKRSRPPVDKAKSVAGSLPESARRAERVMKSISVLREKQAIKVDEQRVQMKMKDRKEREEAEEMERRAADEYNRASQKENDASTMIQKTCQKYMKKVLSKRETGIRQRAKSEEEKLRMKIAAKRIQALYRGFSVRRFLEKAGDQPLLRARASGSEDEPGSFRPPGLPQKKRDKQIPAERVQRDCAFRRRWEREVAIAEMKHLEEESGRLFLSDARWAVEKHAALQEKHALVQRRRESARLVWSRLQEEQSMLDPALPPEDPERLRLAKEIELQGIRIRHQVDLLEVEEKGLYWCRLFIRQHYRRRAAQTASKAGADHTFAWLEEELYAVDAVVSFALKRLEGAADVLEQEFFRAWLNDQITRAGKQRVMIDLEQEFLLEAETARLLKVNGHASKGRETLNELLHAYDIDTQLGAERCGAELASAAAAEDTDEKFKWVSRVTPLKAKEESIRGKVEVPLQRGLEEEVASEERYLNERVTFTGDAADAPIPHFAKIKASLIDPPHHPQHLAFDSWKKVYRLQPWLAAQTQAEQKRKAERASTIQGLEEMRAVVATAKTQEALAAKEVAALKGKLEGFEKRLAYHRSGVPGDAPQEPLSDSDRTRMEIDLQRGREKVADLEEHLQRRNNANAKKSAELKLNEETLEADITAEEERHAGQAAAMAAFCAAEQDEAAATFGKEAADAAMDRMKNRLEALKRVQEDLNKQAPVEQTAAKKKGFMGTMMGFVLGTDKEVDDESEAQEMDYAEQTALIAMRAKLALVNRQIKELSQAKKTIALDHSSANAQLILAEDAMAADDEEGEGVEAEAQKLQTRVREAKLRAKLAKEQEKNQLAQERKEEAALSAKEAKAKKEAEIAKRFAAEMGLDSVGQARGVLAGAKRIQRKIAGGNTIYGGVFDNENAAVEAAIKTRHKTKLGKVEAVVGFAFTVGTEETDAMTSKQARLDSQGLPHYRKMAKGLGGKDPVCLWILKSFDSQEFITEVQVTHADPENASYKNLKPYGFVSCGHPKLAAKGSGQPSLLLWSKKDPHSDGVADIDISYNEADEKKLSDVGFRMAPGLLLDCGLPESRLWYATVKRGAHTLATVKAILHELGEVRSMRKQNPGDESLLAAESKLESKLAQAREAEERKAEDASNPLKSAIETYALTPADIEAFISYFGAMDVERKGTIDVGAFFEYLKWPRNTFANHLFNFMESADEDGGVDFGDFVKLVCSYCMFGKADLLRYAYTVYDQGKGFVSFEDLLSLLNDVHKSNSGPIERALREADLARIGQLYFSHFVDLDTRFPKMFYPIANLQLEMRKKFLGEEFWLRKMLMFNETRANIVKDADGSANKALKAKLREEELMYLKIKTRKALAATQRAAGMVVSRTRENIEKSKWMAKLMSQGQRNKR